MLRKIPNPPKKLCFQPNLCFCHFLHVSLALVSIEPLPHTCLEPACVGVDAREALPELAAAKPRGPVLSAFLRIQRAPSAFSGRFRGGTVDLYPRCTHMGPDHRIGRVDGLTSLCLRIAMSSHLVFTWSSPPAIYKCGSLDWKCTFFCGGLN